MNKSTTNKTSLTLSALGMVALATQVQATPVFSDNFNSENGGVAFLNYGTPNQNGSGNGAGTTYNTTFANWTVSGGSVDLIGWTATGATGIQGLGAPSSTSGAPDYDFLPGNGLYVDLDGTTSQAGTLTSRSIAVTPNADYTLTFDLGGSQRGDQNIVHLMVSIAPSISEIFTLNSGDPFTPETLTFNSGSLSSINLSFHNDGGDDFGALLDDVELDTAVGVGLNAAGVPDGGTTVALLGMGLAGLAVLRRKFKS